MSIRVAISPGDRVVPWINQCPPEWPLRPLKYAAKINARTLGENIASDFEINYIDISSVDSNGRQNPAETMTFGDAPSRARRIVASGDIIISTVRTYLKAISYIENGNDNLICSTGFAVITPSPKVYPKFLFYWVRSEWFVNEIVARSVGVSYPAINAIEIGNLPFPAIPVEEQQIIAGFLDREAARIDELIARKQRLIDLLQEKRTALITHAVTKGLNPDAPMRDSGIEWLGEIAAHWEVKKLKRLGWFRAGAGFPDNEQGLQDEDLPFYKVSDMNLEGNDILMTTCNNSVSRDTAKRLGATVFPKGTIIFPKVGIALLTNKRRILTCGACIDNNTMGFFVKRGNVKYLCYRLLTLDFGRLANPGAVPSMNEGQACNIETNVPPLPEQQAIADFLDRETARIDSLVGRINQAIEKLREYRTSQITAAVTGKIDVGEHVS